MNCLSGVCSTLNLRFCPSAARRQEHILDRSSVHCRTQYSLLHLQIRLSKSTSCACFETEGGQVNCLEKTHTELHIEKPKPAMVYWLALLPRSKKGQIPGYSRSFCVCKYALSMSVWVSFGCSVFHTQIISANKNWL